MRPLPPVLVPLIVAGCGHTPVSYSQPVDVTLPTINQKSVSGANVSVQKNINTVSGNPYGAFVNAAVQQLNGKNPSRIAVTSVTLTLLGTSSATGLQQVFGGPVNVNFVFSAGSGTTTTVGQVGSVSGTSASLTTTFDSRTLSPGDYTSLVQGQFDSVLTGPAASGFATSTLTADVKTTFTFVAYE
jgi:hypothetical protein